MKTNIFLRNTRRTTGVCALGICLGLLAFHVPAVSPSQANYSTTYAFATLMEKAHPESADGPGSPARFANPQGVAVDSAGNVYVTETRNHTIRRITPAGILSTLAGRAGRAGNADGMGSDARFSYPQGLAVDNAGNIYVADRGNNTIRKVTPAGWVTTLAGRAGIAGSTDGTSNAARFSFPSGVAVDGARNIYVADSYNCTIRKVTAAGEVTTLAGSPGIFGGADGVGGNALFNFPISVAADNAGNVYVGDPLNNAIRKVTPAGTVTTLAGGLTYSIGSKDGTGHAAQFYHPQGLAVDRAGNVYVADRGNSTIRRVSPTGEVTTLAGLAGHVGSADGTGSGARFDCPQGVAVDGDGNVYVADSRNGMIRKGIPANSAATPLFQSPGLRFSFAIH